MIAKTIPYYKIIDKLAKEEWAKSSKHRIQNSTALLR